MHIKAYRFKSKTNNWLYWNKMEITVCHRDKNVEEVTCFKVSTSTFVKTTNKKKPVIMKCCSNESYGLTDVWLLTPLCTNAEQMVWVGQKKNAYKFAGRDVDVTSAAIAALLLSSPIVLLPLREQRWPTNFYEVRKHCVTSVHLDVLRRGEGVRAGSLVLKKQGFSSMLIMYWEFH